MEPDPLALLAPLILFVVPLLIVLGYVWGVFTWVWYLPSVGRWFRVWGSEDWFRVERVLWTEYEVQLLYRNNTTGLLAKIRPDNVAEWLDG